MKQGEFTGYVTYMRRGGVRAHIYPNNDTMPLCLASNPDLHRDNLKQGIPYKPGRAWLCQNCLRTMHAKQEATGAQE